MAKETRLRGVISTGSPGTSRPGRFGISPNRADLWLALVILLVLTIAGCSQGLDPRDSPGQQGTRLPGDGQGPSVVFPVHDAPLGTDRGEQYLAGKLVLLEGCLRLEVPSREAINPLPSYLLIWPDSFTYQEEAGTVRVVDGHGRTAAQVGDHIRLSRSEVTYEQVNASEFVAGPYEHCEEPTFWVGDEVSVFDPKNEATILLLPDPKVLFPRQKTVMAVERAFWTAAGVGELVLDGGCLKLDGEHPIIWPAGFTPHVEDGVVQVRNGAGRTIARVGDEIAGGGGYYQGGSLECRGEVFRIYGIKVLPDVEVYFPKQDGTVRIDQRANRFTGELVLNGKCLEVDNGIRLSNGSEILGPVLLIWPKNFELITEDGRLKILNYKGNVVARLGDRVQFRALDLTYKQAIEQGGLEAITPACSSPYWAVGEDFKSVEYP